VWRRLLENSLSAKVSCWLIRLLILGSGYNTMISHLGLIRTFLKKVITSQTQEIITQECNIKIQILIFGNKEVVGLFQYL
ncbi:hypothetical protein, partial [Escherichia coli]|uniref:hypothetical protein n=1 Tax=Escherichia coli TaxID=562 RepID=UPI001ADDC0CB